MYNTVSVKEQQLRNGFFKVGNGKTKVLIIGSCRSVNYINYFDELNRLKNMPYTIYSLDPFNWHWDINDNRVDYVKAIEQMETHPELLKMLSEVDIFIHEYYANFGMFNTFKDGEKNIYQFGIKPKHDICLPNFHDVFLLFNDIIRFTPELKEQAKRDYAAIKGLGSDTIKKVIEIHERNIERFYSVCSKSSFPLFAEYFRIHAESFRLFWTYNHVGTAFTLPLFSGICENIGIELTDSDRRRIEAMPDMFSNNYTQLTQYDQMYFGYKWKEQIQKFNPDKL